MLVDNRRYYLSVQRFSGTSWHQTTQLQLPSNLLSLHPVLTRRQQVNHGFFYLHAYFFQT